MKAYDMNIMSVETPVDPVIYSPYNAIIDYANGKGYTLPNSTELNKLETKISNFIDAGLWNKMIAGFWFNYGDNTLSNFASINLKHPDDAHLGAGVGGIGFGTNGWIGGGTESQYFNTNVILDDEPLFGMTDGSMAFGGTTDDYGSYWGVGTGVSTFFLTRQSRRWGGATHQFGTLAGGNRDIFLNTDGTLNAYLDNVLKNSNTNAVPNNKPTVPFRLLSGTTGNRCRYWFCFPWLTDEERTALYQIITDSYTP